MQGNPVGVTSSFLIPLPRTKVPHYPILTLTTAQEAEKLFMEEANRAFMLTYSGASNYTTAMKESCSRLARNGITTVHYNNGKPVRRSIESAVRMNVLTAVNHSAANITVNNCQKLGCDLVEVSAHQGARPEHAAWQGKVYSLSGTHPDYPPFSVCGLGTAKGICGINCRHSFYPYFPGSERHYTQKDLDSLEDEQVEWKGEKLGRYQAEQKLRYIERQIRHYKREAVLSKAADIDDTAARIKLGQWQAQARQFTKETGLKRDSSREWIGVDGAQPRGLKDKANKPTETINSGSLLPASLGTAEETAKAMDVLLDNPKSNTRITVEKLNIESRPTLVYKIQPTETDIIARLAGGDRTRGSCSSLGFAYIANKAGFYALDFRGGRSLDVFSRVNTIKEIAKLNGVQSFIIEEYNDFTAVHKICKEIQTGKQYYLAAGRHVAIVKKTDNIVQWLEMQSANSSRNTWHILNDDILRRRFGCQKSHSARRHKYKVSTILIDIETLGKNKEFIELVKYINTSEEFQFKGIGGQEK